MSNLSTFAPPEKKGKDKRVQPMQNGKIAVIGAGVFGSWAALSLLREGFDVTLADMWGPGNSRSSSGGETRLIRSFYGENKMYFEMAKYSWEEWKKLEQSTSTSLMQQTGVLWMMPAAEESTFRQMRGIMDDFSHPYELLNKQAFQQRYPLIHAPDIEYALIEKEAGFLEARKATKVVVEQFIFEGGKYVSGEVQIAEGHPFKATIGGSVLDADAYVFACGPWLKKMFPFLKLEITRQEVHYFGLPENAYPGYEKLIPWIDWSPSNFYYGFPGHDHRGFKIAHDVRGPEIDPTSMNRIPGEKEIESARRYLSFRFPFLEEAPLSEARVCQYSNSTDGNFIFDKHPHHENVWILGGGSGHGFKHGPAIGKFVVSGLQNGIISAAFLIP